MAIFSLSIIGTTTGFFSLSGSRLKQQLNKKIIIILNFFHYLRSTVIGTGAAATGAIVTLRKWYW
jgi:hypothetical protein